MSAGTPLTDSDRAPWLDNVGGSLAYGDGRRIIGCSALKRSCRERIRVSAGEPAGFPHLSGSRAVIEARMHPRKGHFMPVTLLDSRFATLEPLQPDEVGYLIDIDQPVGSIRHRADPGAHAMMPSVFTEPDQTTIHVRNQELSRI